MGKASSSKKVARVARTGGGRVQSSGSRSWAFPVVMGLVVVVGTALVWQSRDERTVDTTGPRPQTAGKAAQHWHSAVGINICGTFVPPLADQNNDAVGIHTHGDGVAHVHPKSVSSAGKKATLGKFFSEVGAKVSASEINVPGQPDKKNGDTCPDGKEGVVRSMTWPSKAPDASGSIVKGNPSSIHFEDGSLITVAFLPADAEIPRPPSADELDKLSDVTPQPTPSVSLPPGITLPPGVTLPGGATLPPAAAPEGEVTTPAPGAPEASTPDASTPEASTPEATPVPSTPASAGP
ncbi:MAG TPA: hypothetical protein VM121_09365 [Acidimicrobiales bacterium]|nr:hypothetical protein [Acidimicrobiales bacterium]